MLIAGLAIIIIILIQCNKFNTLSGLSHCLFESMSCWACSQNVFLWSSYELALIIVIMVASFMDVFCCCLYTSV